MLKVLIISIRWTTYEFVVPYNFRITLKILNIPFEFIINEMITYKFNLTFHQPRSLFITTLNLTNDQKPLRVTMGTLIMLFTIEFQLKNHVIFLTDLQNDT